ncbi:Regulator of G-protein signaling 12 [Pteropus alecto]|uniref:Regulator of G-protein signaling 12 n=1 Tax=Pteropus alecto TaxID=9402 RepID=L5K5C5_PTEAL|nr:Regulator of G-protein signaling 12 [Pteropus alecto]
MAKAFCPSCAAPPPGSPSSRAVVPGPSLPARVTAGPQGTERAAEAPSAHGRVRSGLREGPSLDFPHPRLQGGTELFRVVLEAQASPRFWVGVQMPPGRGPRFRGSRTETRRGVPEAFFELISKAQSNRADDQRGLLRKEDLVLPEFLRLPPGAAGPCPAVATAKAQALSKEKTPQPREPWGPARHPESPAGSPVSCTPTSPTHHTPEAEAGGVQTVEGELVADLTLTGEGHISSPSSTLLPPPPTPKDSAGPPRPGTARFGSPAHL